MLLSMPVYLMVNRPRKGGPYILWFQGTPICCGGGRWRRTGERFKDHLNGAGGVLKGKVLVEGSLDLNQYLNSCPGGVSTVSLLFLQRRCSTALGVERRVRLLDNSRRGGTCQINVTS